jgi:hypothetical protein
MAPGRRPRCDVRTHWDCSPNLDGDCFSKLRFDQNRPPDFRLHRNRAPYFRDGKSLRQPEYVRRIASASGFPKEAVVGFIDTKPQLIGARSFHNKHRDGVRVSL